MAHWIAIVESPALNLPEIEGEILRTSDCPEKKRQLYYIQLLVYFYRQDAEGISAHRKENEAWLQQNCDLKILTDLRYLIRKGEFSKEEIRNLLSAQIEACQLFQAETEFLAATLYQLKGEFAISERLYKSSSFLYKEASAQKKSLRALLSSIAAYSCSHPDSRLFAEYMHVYRSAEAISEHLTAATALLNISREFQRLGGLSIALEYVSKSIELLNDSALGSRELGLSLVHRAQLHLELKNMHLASDDIYHALLIPHAEVQSACKVLSDKYSLNLRSISSKQTLPTWQERVSERSIEKPLAKLESQLLSLIAESPKTKFELIDALYGEVIDFEVRENRFKNLLSRLRSRYPELILLSDQKYHLNDPLSKTYLRKAGGEE